MGLVGLEKDAPRPGRTPSIPKTTVERVIELTTREKPDNATHWSTRTMTTAAGISEASVRRVWRAHGLKPHLVETFKVSKDPRFGPSYSFRGFRRWEEHKGLQRQIRVRVAEVSKSGLRVQSEKAIAAGTVVNLYTAEFVPIGRASIRECTTKGLDDSIGLYMPGRSMLDL